MHILRVHNRYRERGGEDVSFENEVELLSDYGHSVDTLEFANDDIPDRPSIGSHMQLAATTIWSQRARERIATAIAERRPDVVHFDNSFPLVSPGAYSVCSRQGVATVQTLHNYRPLCPAATFYRDGRPCEDCLGRTPPWPGVLHACYRGSRAQTGVVASMLTAHRLRRTWSRDVDRYIAPTNFVRRKFIEGGFPEDRIAVKPHFVRSGSPKPGHERGGFLSVGRLVEYKGTDLLPDAWKALDGNVSLTIAGDGPLMDSVVSATSRDRRITYAGRQLKQSVLESMQVAVAVIVASRLYETFGLTIVEAFASGTPAIASRLGAMAELVEDGVTGLLFEPGDAADLAAKIRWAADHPAEMRRMGGNARMEYEAKYTPERNYEMLMDIYRQAIDHAVPRGR